MSKFLDYNGLDYMCSNHIKPTFANLVDKTGKNIFKINPNAYQNELNGLTATFNADGSVTVTGTMTDTTKSSIIYISNRRIDITAYKGCILSGGISDVAYISIQNSNSPWNTVASSTTSAVTIPTTVPAECVMYIVVSKTSSAVNYTFYPMICSATDYKISPTYQPYYENRISNTDIDSVWNGTYTVT